MYQINLADDDDKKCKECDEKFTLNSEGKCKRITCKVFDKNNKNECTECYPGYYVKDKACKKITLPYCISLSSSNDNECLECLKGITKVDGKCVAPNKIIIGCSQYDGQGECINCMGGYTKNEEEKNCQFIACSDEQIKLDFCGACEVGFYYDINDKICVGYNVTIDNNNNATKRNKIEYTFLLLIIALLI